jgi:hypothetical protein
MKPNRDNGRLYLLAQSPLVQLVEVVWRVTRMDMNRVERNPPLRDIVAGC